jgi:small subunit ribosomal protein S3
MGQKVNPIGLRLGINKLWDSYWYADKDYAKLLHEDLKIKKFIEDKLSDAGISKVVIERTSKSLVVNLSVAKPGVVIGKKGADIENLRKKIQSLSVSPDVRLNIVEVRKVGLDARLVADTIAKQLVKRVSFRRAMKKAVQQTLKEGAEGIRVNCSGRLGGAEIARMEWYREGRVPLHTLRADIDYGEATAHTTYGACGIKVWIYKGEVVNNPVITGKKF